MSGISPTLKTRIHFSRGSKSLNAPRVFCFPDSGGGLCNNDKFEI